MEIIDAQQHEPGPFTLWPGDEVTRRQVYDEVTLTAMDSAGVDGAVLFPAVDDFWAIQLAEQQPERFAAVIRLKDADATDLEHQMHTAAASGGVKGFRFLTWNPGAMSRDEARPVVRADIERGKFDRGFAIAREYKYPVFIYANGLHQEAGRLAQRYPDTEVVLDHLGILQPPMETAENPGLRSVEDLLALSTIPNLSVKLCGLPALAEDPFPYADARRAAREIVDAFGASRVMWASDIWRFRGRLGSGWTLEGADRVYSGVHTYAESLHFLRESRLFTEEEKTLVLGGAVRRALAWAKGDV